MWAKHDPHLFYLSCFLLFVSEGALLIFRFFYGRFGYYPVLAERRHRFSASAVPSIPRFGGPSTASVLQPGRQCGDYAKCDFALVFGILHR